MDPLQNEILKYVKRGYTVVHQTDTTAQLIKRKKFSIFWALIWTLTMIGWVFYLIYYWMKKDKLVYLNIQNGQVITTKG